MDTILTESPVEAAAVLRAGGIVGFPTETVYGLGADVFNESAIAKIFDAKNRPPDNPLIAHICSFAQIELLASDMTSNARRLIDAFFPGPLTVVLNKRDEVPGIATAGLDSIGIRMPGDLIAREFLFACEMPVVAPSANLSGRPSPTTWQAVYEDLTGRIDCILQGQPTVIGLESTVIDCRNDAPVVLRKGAVSLEQISEVVDSVIEAEAGEALFRSPGLRHQHYSPRARVLILERHNNNSEIGRSAFIGLSEPSGGFVLEERVFSVEEYARKVFEFFRECDRRGIETILCEPVVRKGIGAALMDRIERAANKNQ